MDGCSGKPPGPNCERRDSGSETINNAMLYANYKLITRFNRKAGIIKAVIKLFLTTKEFYNKAYKNTFTHRIPYTTTPP